MLFWLRQFFSNREFHRRAFDEVFIVTAVSVVPLLALPFIASAKSDSDAAFSISTTIWSAISSGQLYLYSLSVFGNIIWLCVEDGSNKEFPPRKYFVLGSILAAFLCILIYSVDPALSKPLNPVLVQISIWIYVVYLAMYYALLVFKMLRAPTVNDTVETEVNNLIGQSRSRRRQAR